MHRYFIFLSYKGTHYCGWQRQPKDVTVQQILEAALAKLMNAEISITGAGRTDAGVHARMMTAHFDLLSPLLEPTNTVAKLNSILPKDIAISAIKPVVENSHARFSALSRTYIYTVSDVKDPFEYENYCFMSIRNIDFDRMNEAAKILLEYNDFTSFSKLHTDVKTNNCRISEAYWQQVGDRQLFTITADRFLRNMVRAIVGTLFAVGRGKMSVDDFRAVIEAKNRSYAGTSARPEGLALVNIEYPSNIFI